MQQEQVLYVFGCVGGVGVFFFRPCQRVLQGLCMEVGRRKLSTSSLASSVGGAPIGRGIIPPIRTLNLRKVVRLRYSCVVRVQ